eukprot:Em0012g219a
MASSNNPAILEQLLCPIYLRILHQPLELPCRALVCTACMVEWFKVFKLKAATLLIQALLCQTCRKDIKACDNNEPVLCWLTFVFNPGVVMGVAKALSNHFNISELCALRLALRALRSAPCALRLALCALRSAPCALRSAPCALRLALCASRPAPRALRLAPCASRPAPRALRLAPCASRPAPRALRLAPCASRPAPRALRLAPCASRPAPRALRLALCA